MAPTAKYSLGDALSEIETVLRIRKKLEEMAPKPTVLGERWMDNILRIMIQELESTSSSSSTLQNLNYLGRMLDILDDLIHRKLDDMADQLTMALVRHKSRLESTHRHGSNAHDHHDTHHKQSSKGNSSTSGRDTRKDFDVTVCSSQYHKFYRTDGPLRLGWHEDFKAFHVFRDQQNISSLIPEMQIDPKSVRALYFSHGRAKILVQSSAGGADIPFYFKANDPKIVWDFCTFVAGMATDRLQTHMLDK
ncbi:MAG: hypothetical protein Q9186_006827 [Xanthomendoza sp. 1 TL-2023]